MSNKTTVQITITGPQGSGKTIIARAILELLHEADVQAMLPEESSNSHDGDSIEQLGHLRGSRVIIKTSNASDGQ